MHGADELDNRVEEAVSWLTIPESYDTDYALQILRAQQRHNDFLQA